MAMPSVHQIAAYLESFFPKKVRDVPFLYHIPRDRQTTRSYNLPDVLPIDHHDESQTGGSPIESPDLTRLTCDRLILSITPTAGVYDAMRQHSKYPPMVFLHRPFDLNRRQVRYGTTVVSSHVGFDEVLTVGFNLALAERLGVVVAGDQGVEIVEQSPPEIDPERAMGAPTSPMDRANVEERHEVRQPPKIICLKGYKGDPDRKIGLIGRSSTTTSTNQILARIRHEFGSLEAVFGFGDEDDYSTVLQQDKSVDLQPLLNVLGTFNQESDPTKQIFCLAIMNAFHPAEVDRVLDAVRKHGLSGGAEGKVNGIFADAGSHGGIVYLTGAARVPGLTYALQQGLKVVCVGHRTCEEWGIRYLADKVRKCFPQIHVQEIFEEEEPAPKKAKGTARQHDRKTTAAQ